MDIDKILNDFFSPFKNNVIDEKTKEMHRQEDIDFYRNRDEKGYRINDE